MIAVWIPLSAPHRLPSGHDYQIPRDAGAWFFPSVHF